MRGAWRGLVGPLGAASSAAVLGAAGVGVAAVTRSTRERRSWPVAGVVGVVAADLIGGMVAFQIPETRRHYAETSLGSRLVLAIGHVQCFALPLLGEGTWGRALKRWAGVVCGTMLLQSFVAEQDRRLVGSALALFLGSADLATDLTRQRWFGPVWAVKLVAGHATLPNQCRPPGTVV